MRVLILWTSWSGYMDACAKELQRLLSCEMDIVCREVSDETAPFERDKFFQYPCNSHILSAESLLLVRSQPFDLILISGWNIKEYLTLAFAKRQQSIRVLCMDNQWSASMRQWIGILAFRTYLRRVFDIAFVPGGRQARFAANLGFGPNEIIEGLYSAAGGVSEVAVTMRERSFLFVGRLVPEKGIQQLAAAWRDYVQRNARPWTLKACGVGPLSNELAALPSTQCLGFVQPSQLREVMAQSSALVLPSVREPWGVVIHEAAQAGLGLVLTQACGASDYFLRDRLNGRLVSTGEADALYEALQWFHDLDDGDLKRVNERSVLLGAQYTPLSWACAASRALAIA